MTRTLTRTKTTPPQKGAKPKAQKTRQKGEIQSIELQNSKEAVLEMLENISGGFMLRPTEALTKEETVRYWTIIRLSGMPKVSGDFKARAHRIAEMAKEAHLSEKKIAMLQQANQLLHHHELEEDAWQQACTSEQEAAQASKILIMDALRVSLTLCMQLNKFSCIEERIDTAVDAAIMATETWYPFEGRDFSSWVEAQTRLVAQKTITRHQAQRTDTTMHLQEAVQQVLIIKRKLEDDSIRIGMDGYKASLKDILAVMEIKNKTEKSSPRFSQKTIEEAFLTLERGGTLSADQLKEDGVQIGETGLDFEESYSSEEKLLNFSRSNSKNSLSWLWRTPDWELVSRLSTNITEMIELVAGECRTRYPSENTIQCAELFAQTACTQEGNEEIWARYHPLEKDIYNPGRSNTFWPEHKTPKKLKSEFWED